MTFIGYLIAGALLVIALIVTIVAEVKVSSNYSKYSKIASKSGLTGREMAEKIIASANLNIKINMVKGTLSDHYNPINKSINISKANMESNSIAALGVVAHELSHAIQDAKGYAPFKIRQFVVKATNAVSKLLLPLLILGIIFDALYIGGVVGEVFIWIAVAFYGASVLANLATLPVEIDASRRALKMLNGFGYMDSLELQQTKKVLSSAALTYLASLLVSLAYFLRFLFIALSLLSDR